MKYPGDDNLTIKKVSVEDLATCDMNTKSERYQKVKNHRNVTYNPPGDGNCQFHALSVGLEQLGIYQLPSEIRQNIVDYFEIHSAAVDGTPL